MSKHHYAIHLASRNNLVFFLNPPSSEWCIADTAYKHLKVLNYSGFWKGLYRLPKWLRAINLKQVYNKLEELSGGEFEVIWTFDNSVFFDLDVLPASILKISHIVDLNQNFQTEISAASANVCFGVNDAIVNRLKKYNSNSYLIPHGVTIHQAKKSSALPGKNKKKALYFGNLAMPHLNWNLMRMAIERFQQVDFILLGSNHQAVPLRKCQNLFLHDPVPASHLPSYMKAADLLYLFYTDTYHSSYATPHKMLEYLSSGKPIVSNCFANYTDKSDLIYQSDNHEKWMTNFEMALNEVDDIIVKERIALALDNTYEKRLDRIENIVNQRA